MSSKYAWNNFARFNEKDYIFDIIFRFNRLKPYVVLDRLVFRKHYALAIQIAKHLKLPESRILEHWAFHKVNNDESINHLTLNQFFSCFSQIGHKYEWVDF